jgi:hypothetical protein
VTGLVFRLSDAERSTLAAIAKRLGRNESEGQAGIYMDSSSNIHDEPIACWGQRVFQQNRFQVPPHKSCEM